MRVDGSHYRTIWPAADETAVSIVDQTRLPHDFAIVELKTLAEAAHEVREPLRPERRGDEHLVAAPGEVELDAPGVRLRARRRAA